MVSADGKITQFKMWHEGFYSLIMQDSSGKWSGAAAGSYSIDGNTYKETIRYHNIPEYVGASDWQTYELKGDTLYFKGFDKVVYVFFENYTGWVQGEPIGGIAGYTEDQLKGFEILQRKAEIDHKDVDGFIKSKIINAEPITVTILIGKPV